MTPTLIVALAIVALVLNTGCSTVTGPTRKDAPVELLDAIDLEKLDLNQDGHVSASDLAYFAQATKADLTGDQMVDQADAARIGTLLGESYPRSLEGLTAPELARVAAVEAADLNQDGVVTFLDLIAFGTLKVMAERADVNEDGKVNESDRLEIEKAVGEDFTPRDVASSTPAVTRRAHGSGDRLPFREPWAFAARTAVAVERRAPRFNKLFLFIQLETCREA